MYFARLAKILGSLFFTLNDYHAKLHTMSCGPLCNGPFRTSNLICEVSSVRDYTYWVIKI